MVKFAGCQAHLTQMPRHTSPAHFFGYEVFKMFYLATILGVFLLPQLCDALNPEHNINVFFNGNDTCVTEYDPTVDYFPHKVIPDDSDNWDVQYFNAYKVVVNKATNQTFVLYQCGTPRPSPNLTDLGVPEEQVQYMSVPRRSLAVDETVPLTMLEILGYTKDIKYIANSTTQYVTSPCIQRIIEDSGSKIILSDDTAAATKQLLDVDLHIASPYNPVMGNNTVVFSGTADPGTLHRAEWIEFLSVFLNLEESAGKYMEGVRTRYEDLNAAAAPRNPKLTVAYITAFNGTYTIDEAVYKQEYMTDAGGNPIKGGDFTNLTAFHEALADVDVIIDEAYWPFGNSTKTLEDFQDIYNITPSQAKTFKFLQTGSVYGIDGRVNPRGWLDWYEGGVVRADLMLGDFVSVLQNEQIMPENYDRIWLRRLANETQTVVTAADCEAVPWATFVNTTAATPAVTTAVAAANKPVSTDAAEAVPTTSEPASGAAGQAMPTFATVLLAVLAIFVLA